MSATLKDRITAVFDGSVWLFPKLNDDEKLTLKWRGIRKTWDDNTTMPWLDSAGHPDRDVTELVELYLEWKISMYDDNDIQLAASKRTLYINKLADIIADDNGQARMDLTDTGINMCP